MLFVKIQARIYKCILLYFRTLVYVSIITSITEAATGAVL